MTAPLGLPVTAIRAPHPRVLDGPRFGLWGEHSRDFFTWHGLVIVHHSRDQMQWLHPGATVREVPTDIPAEQCVPLWAHPDYGSVAWNANGDLERSQFRCPT